MKSIKFLTGTAVALAMFTACDVEYPAVDILPDTIFEQSGIQDMETISIYDTDETIYTIVRTAGLSKGVNMQIKVDPALLAEYNELNNANYELLDSQYYSFPEEVELPAQVKTVEVPITLKPKALVSAEKLSGANNKVLPIRIADSTLPLEDSGSQMTVLLHPVIVDPLITVTVPREAAELEFLSIVPLKQTHTLMAKTNFRTIDLSKVTFELDASKVAEYNAAHQTDYVALPKEYFTIGTAAAGTFTFDSENYTLSNDVTFDCYQIDESNTYLAPFVLKNTAGYAVVESAPIYVIVSKSNLNVTIRNASQDISTNTGKGSIEIRLSSELVDQQVVKLKYDQSKIAGYNQTNGKSYKTLDASLLTMQDAVFAPGETSATMSFTINASSMAYESDTYVIPFTVDIDALPAGTVVPQDFSTRYVVFQKSLEGNYTKTVHGAELSNRVINNKIYRQGSGCRAINTGYFGNYPENALLTYAINYNASWADGLLYFYISDENYNGDPTKKVLKGFKDRPNDNSGRGQDPITDEGKSYFDTVNESFHFDLFILDAANAANGGMPVQVDLTNRTGL